VRGTDPRSAQIGRPDGVTFSFQVSRNNVEPRESSRARNLLSKDDWRAALADEPEPGGPEVALVAGSVPSPGDAEGLAWTRAGPNGSIIWPACKAQGMGPSAKAGEQVDLGVSFKVIRLNR